MIASREPGCRPASDRFGWCLLALGLLAYGWATAGQFVYDDYHSVCDNPALTDISQLPRLLWDVEAFSALDNRMYRPALLVSFSLTHALFGMSSVAFKLGNVLLHCMIAVLLYGALRRLAVPRSAARGVAGCFAVHPVAAEAINMVSARSELLLGLGLVLALRCYLATRRASFRDRPARAIGLWLALGSLVGACLWQQRDGRGDPRRASGRGGGTARSSTLASSGTRRRRARRFGSCPRCWSVSATCGYAPSCLGTPRCRCGSGVVAAMLSRVIHAIWLPSWRR